jgi:prepilin-type N-terminal cleavage/methylation domain-containing protein
MKKGFTLLELAAVLALIGTVVALGAPRYERFLLAARAAEAPAILEAIAHAEKAYFRDHGHYLACEATLEKPPPGGVVTFTATTDGWKDLAFAPDGGTRFSYTVESTDGRSFRVVAHGDLDGDGVVSTYTYDGRTALISTLDELE